MAIYRLLAGVHQQADLTAEPVILKDPQGRETKKYPTKTFTTSPGNNLVPNNTDLVARFGADKFALVSGQPGDTEVYPAQTTFPNGQVSSGYQLSNMLPAETPADSEQPVPQIVAESPQEARRLAAKMTPEQFEEHKAGQRKSADKQAEMEATANANRGEMDLESMTVHDLKAYAAAQEIDIPTSARSKQEIIDVIKKG